MTGMNEKMELWRKAKEIVADALELAPAQRERQTLAQLTHPHIARLLDESKLERLWLKNAEEAMAGLPLSPPNTEAPISRPVGPAALPASAAAR